jgi:predicted O-methyltransferase YrrM
MLMIRNKALRQFVGFCQTFNLLQLKLLLKQPARARSFPGHIYRKYMMLAKSDGWRATTMDELVPPAERLKVQLYHLEGGGVCAPLLELACLALLTRYSNARSIFEIGTFRGRTAINFAVNSPDDAKVYTLDLPEHERAEMKSQAKPDDARLIGQCRTGVEFHGTQHEEKIRQLYGNSLKFDFSPYVQKMDLVFIDGCHHYEVVRSDTANALKIIKPGGLIIWHDFANFGDYHDVTRGVLDMLPGDEIYQIEDTQLAIYWPNRWKGEAVNAHTSASVLPKENHSAPNAEPIVVA